MGNLGLLALGSKAVSVVDIKEGKKMREIEG